MEENTLSQLLNERCVVFDIDAQKKEDVLAVMVERLKEAKKIADAQLFLKDVQAREAISPTFVGFGLGMPHGKTDNVLEAAICFGRLKNPVVWDPESRDTADMVIMIAVPDADAGDTHLDILAKLSRNMMHDDFRNSLRTNGQTEVFEILTEALEG